MILMSVGPYQIQRDYLASSRAIRHPTTQTYEQPLMLSVSASLVPAAHSMPILQDPGRIAAKYAAAHSFTTHRLPTNVGARFISPSGSAWEGPRAYKSRPYTSFLPLTYLENLFPSVMRLHLWNA